MSNANELKKMRIAAVVLCGAMLAVLPAMAQKDGSASPNQDQMQGMPAAGAHHGRHGMDPAKRIEMMQRRLNLTPDQVTQVKGIVADGHTQMEALHSNTSLSRQDRHKQMMAMMKDQNAKVRAVLTPDQQTKFDAMQARRRERMHAHHDAGSGAQPLTPPTPPQ